MKKYFLVGVILMAFIIIPVERIFLSEFTVWGEDISKIIVKVNKQVITSRDLDEYCKIVALRLFDGEEEASSNDKEFRAKALQRLIEDTLILDKARQDEVNISSSRIEGKIAQLTASYLSREEFEKSLTDKGLTITLLRQKIKEQYMLRSAIDKYVKFQVNVLPKEISSYYVEHPDNFYSPAGYVFYIAKTRDNSILEKMSQVIKGGRILEAQARYSNILHKVESSKDELKPRISEILKSLNPGKHRIKKIDEMFYLIYLEKLIAPHKSSLEEVKEEIYAYLWDLKFREKFNQWVDKLKAGALIKNYYEHP